MPKRLRRQKSPNRYGVLTVLQPDDVDAPSASRDGRTTRSHKKGSSNTPSAALDSTKGVAAAAAEADDDGDYEQPIAETEDDVIIQSLSRQPQCALDATQPITTTKMPEVQVRTGDIVTRIAPSVKLPKFDGKGSVELFVRRFQNIATFYHWTEAKRLFLLQSHLD